MKVTNIIWATDGESMEALALPVTMELPSDMEEDRVADYLSDEYGFLVESFDIASEEPKVEMDMEEPFGWLMDGDWNWVADYCTSQESYGDLDILYRVLNGDIDKAGEWCEDMTTEEIKRTYSERFPLLLAGVLKNLAEAIESGEIQFRIRYPQ